MDKRQLSLNIKAEAKNLGFLLVALPVPQLWTRRWWIPTANGLIMASMPR